MPNSYYKYAERQADSYVNWSEIGKNISDMLSDENKLRQQKKDAIDQSSREFANVLANAPQGQFQDANQFTTNFAHDMMEQNLLDIKLLKSGKMKERDFTLRRQNRMDGTNTLFDLQKLYQENYAKRMEGIQNGNLQALNTFNMANVEGFGDFSKSKAVINPMDGTVNIGMMRPNPKTGVMELTNDVMPVNVARGKILNEIKTFKVYDALTTAKGRLGNQIETLYSAAKTSGAGTITKLVGEKAIGKYAQFKPAIDEFNVAVNKMVGSFFTNPYNMSSVLTENVGGKYNSESFTYNKDEADKDPSKILLKINKGTGLPTLDETGKNYGTQKKEAEDWVKNQFMSMLDSERTVQTTSQLSRNDMPSYLLDRGDKNKTAKAGGNMLAKLYGGTDAEVQAAVDHFKGLSYIKDVSRDSNGIKIYYRDGSIKDVSFKTAEGNPLGTEQFIQASSKALLGDEVDVNDAMKGALSAKIGGLNTKVTRNVQAPQPVEDATEKYKSYVSSAFTPDIFTQKSDVAITEMQNKLKDIGYIVKDTGGYLGNSIKVTSPVGGKDAPSIELDFNENETDANTRLSELNAWLEGQAPIIKNYIENANKKGIFGGAAPAPAAASNNLNASSRRTK
jgi:hypothetical protein